MAKAKTARNTARAVPANSQAQRFLDAARKARVDQSGQAFHRTMGKITLAKSARKTSKGQVGG